VQATAVAHGGHADLTSAPGHGHGHGTTVKLRITVKAAKP
jgi:hypothetical protein